MNFSVFMILTIGVEWSLCVCKCGRGGLCKVYNNRNPSLAVSAQPCSCSKVSNGIFKDRPKHCNQLVSHCSLWTKCFLSRAKCLNGFGAPVCICPRHSMGYDCSVRRNTSAEGSQLIHIWYPVSRWTSWVPVVGTSLPLLNTIFSFKFEDGRIYQVNEIICSGIEFEIMMKRCGRGPDCTFLEKEMAPYLKYYYECNVPVPFNFQNDPVRAVYIKDVPGPVGYHHDVDITISQEGVVYHHNRGYRVFLETRPFIRKCPYQVKFSGCDGDPEGASEYKSASKVVLSSLIILAEDKVSCPVKSYSFSWFASPLGQYQNLKLIGVDQLAVFTPYDLGFYHGTLSVQIYIGFLGTVNIPEETLTTMCYVKLVRSKIELSVQGFSQIYECGNVVNVILKAVVIASSMPVETHNFYWACPNQLCGSVERKQPVLDFWTRMECGKGFVFSSQISVVVSHNYTEEIGNFSGYLKFSSLPHNMIIVCDPDCNHVNPGFQLKIIVHESPDRGSTFRWIIPSDVHVHTQCGNSSLNSIVLSPHALKRDTLYEFEVSSDFGAKQFNVKTLPGPEDINCIVAPNTGHPLRDKFNVTCYAHSEYQPLTYLIYEGENYLVATSSNRKVSNLELTNGNITIKIVDSYGVTGMFKMVVDLQKPTEGELLEARDKVPFRILQLHSKLYAKDYNGAANGVDSITKLSLSVDISFALKLQLWDVIVRIRNCTVMDCVVKTLNSVQRLLLTKTNNDTVGADDFVFNAGVALYSIAHFLNYLDEKQVASDAYGYVSVLGAIHDAAVQVMEFVDPVLFNSFLDEDIRRIHYRKVQAGTIYARLAMLKVGEFVTNHIAYQSPPFEQRTGDGKKKITVIAHNLKYINCILASEKNKSYIQFTPEAIRQLNLAGTRIAIVVVDYSKKYFWWAHLKSANYGEMIDVFVFLLVRGKWKQLTGKTFPVEAQTTSVQVSKGSVEGMIINPTMDETYTDLDSYVNVYGVPVPRGYGILHLVFPNHLIGRIHVNVSTGERPDFSIMNATETLLITNQYHEYYGEQAGSKVYVGIWSRRPSLNYSFEIYLVRCVIWGEQMWKSEACRFVKYVQNDTVMCACRHMSLFNVVTSVPVVELVPSMKIQMKTITYYNWAVPGVIFCVLVLFSLLLGVIYFLDKREKGNAIFLVDNYPADNYPYLVGVFTGERHSAGTSAAVAIRLIGDKFISRVHILNPTKSYQILDMGQDSWFILFSKQRLGDVREIVIWHDNTGPTPDWYCTEVVIWDMNTEAHYTFTAKTWITYENLFIRGDTAFVFGVRDRRKKRSWGDIVGNLFFSFLRQGHHWISIFLIHPRSPYTRLERTLLAFTLVMSVIAVSITCEDVGPATDAPTAQIPGIAVLCISLLFSILVVTTIAQMLRAGKKNVVNERIESLGLQSVGKNKGAKAMARRYLVLPITYLPITTNEPFTQFGNRKVGQWMMPRRWILAAYITSGIVIIFCVVLIVVKGWGMGHNSFVKWIMAFMIVIFCEAFVLDPILVATTTLLVAHYVGRTSLDLVAIGVDPYEDTIPFLERNKRLTNALHQRVKPCYKPPLWSKVKAVGSLPPTSDYLKTSVILAILLLSLSLVYYTERKHDFFMNEQLNDLFATSKSPQGVGLDTVRNRTRYFDYVRETVLPALHHLTWYNGKHLKHEENELETQFEEEKTTERYRGFCADYSTKLVGVPRLRQKRVSLLRPIVVSDHFQNEFPNAYSHLNVENEDTKTYLPSWRTPQEDRVYYNLYKYLWPQATGTGKILGPSGSSLSGGGYVETLHWSLGKSLGNLVDLELDGWLDNATRYVFLTFNLYNLYADKISYVTIVTECLPSGVYRSRTLIDSASFSVAHVQWERATIATIVVLLVVLTVHFSMTLTIISQHGIETYVKKVGGMINIALIITGYGVIVTCINRYIRFVASFEEINAAARDEYTPIYWRFVHNEICFFFIATFGWFVIVFWAVHVHKLISSEAIDKTIGRIQNLILVKFTGIMALYICYTYSSVGLATSEIQYFFFLLSFKEGSYIRFSDSITNSLFIIFAIVLFVILNKFNTAAFYKRYAEAVYKPTLIDPISRILLRKKGNNLPKHETTWEVWDAFDPGRSVSRQTLSIQSDKIIE